MRRIRSDEWRPYRELRLEALKAAPLAFVEQYDDAVDQPDQYWQDRVQRSASGNVSSTFVLAARGRLLGKASCFVEADVTDAVSAPTPHATQDWRRVPRWGPASSGPAS